MATHSWVHLGGGSLPLLFHVSSFGQSSASYYDRNVAFAQCWPPPDPTCHFIGQITASSIDPHHYGLHSIGNSLYHPWKKPIHKNHAEQKAVFHTSKKHKKLRSCVQAQRNGSCEASSHPLNLCWTVSSFTACWDTNDPCSLWLRWCLTSQTQLRMSTSRPSPTELATSAKMKMPHSETSS